MEECKEYGFEPVPSKKQMNLDNQVRLKMSPKAPYSSKQPDLNQLSCISGLVSTGPKYANVEKVEIQSIPEKLFSKFEIIRI